MGAYLWPRVPGCHYPVLLLCWDADWLNCDRDDFRRLGTKEMYFYLQRHYGKLITSGQPRSLLLSCYGLTGNETHETIIFHMEIRAQFSAICTKKATIVLSLVLGKLFTQMMLCKHVILFTMSIAYYASIVAKATLLCGHLKQPWLATTHINSLFKWYHVRA